MYYKWHKLIKTLKAEGFMRNQTSGDGHKALRKCCF